MDGNNHSFVVVVFLEALSQRGWSGMNCSPAERVIKDDKSLKLVELHCFGMQIRGLNHNKKVDCVVSKMNIKNKIPCFKLSVEKCFG